MMTIKVARTMRLHLQLQCGLAFLGVLMSAAAQAPSSADTPPAQSDTTTLHVTTRLVVLDVVVLDKSGHPVSNLDRSQFSITENKVPQTLRSFDPPSGHAMPGGSEVHPVVHGTADLAKIGNAPVNILVFDELNTKWDGTAYARMQMEKFLKAQPETLTVPTLLVAAGDSRFVVLHDYTQSRAELLESIRTHFPQYPWQMMRGASGNTGIELMEQTLGALSQIAESSRGTPGRKNVIWVGSGYPSIDTNNLKFDDEDKLEAVIRRVTDRMLAARVTLYMVDPAGVQVSTQDTGSGDSDGSFTDTGVTNTVGPFTGKLEFSTFATATGGEIFSNRNDLDIAIGQGVKDGGVYYTLSYSPTSSSDQAQPYRQIRVRVKDRSLRVFTRDGYFPDAAPVDPLPVAGAKPTNQLQFDLVSAARTRLVYNGLKVEASRAANGYVLLVGTKDLHWAEQPDESRLTEVTVMAVFFNAKDKKLQSNVIELKEKTGKDGQLNGSEQVALKVPFEPPAGTARIRFVVRDAATGVLGTADALQ
jgi:VWFA-related protein